MECDLSYFFLERGISREKFVGSFQSFQSFKLYLIYISIKFSRSFFLCFAFFCSFYSRFFTLNKKIFVICQEMYFEINDSNETINN